jgi:putative NADH-flavin reductase
LSPASAQVNSSWANDLITDAQGNSRISFDDYAIALVDELENPHRRGRFTIGY